MARTLAVAIAAASVGVMATGASAEPLVAASIETQLAALATTEHRYSTECQVNCLTFEGKSPLRGIRRALREKRVVRVLAIGSSSTSGIGATSPGASYPVRLENDLEGVLKGVDVDVVSRGIPGEVGQGAANRMRNEVAEVRPDLVVWQVGTNDAMARINAPEFAETLRSSIKWFQRNRIDVMLIDPQYVERLAADEHYMTIVQTITQVAREERVPLVHRFDATADLAKKKDGSGYLATDKFHLNDLGYRCMAQYVARAIVVGILNAEADPASQQSGETKPN
jgi:lysophospholipase L1-like esterase